MTASTSVHSNALNFMSYMKNGVDTRTGQYTISVSLPEIKTNDLRGPGVGLALAYNPLNNQDSGFGLGWNLQLSQYSPGNQVLSLSTGETFKVTGSDSATGQLTMKEKKLDSFHFYQQDDTHYRVMHKSGLVEILEVRGSAQNRVALPVEIYSPEGHRVTLDYATFSGSEQLLKEIKDDSGEVLLTVERKSDSVEMVLMGAASSPLASFVMTLQGSDRHVTQITLPTEDKASWRFGYRLVRDHLCIESVETPTGGREEILYQDTGHQFPAGSGRTALPRVTRHRTYPGFGQPEVDVRYTYPENKNFLGFGLSVPWSDDGLDNLYKFIGTYDYQCVETLFVDDQPVRSIERKFNQFHLLTLETTTQNNNGLTLETTTQNNNVQTVETSYYLTPNVPFEAQPNYYQMPKEVTTRWSLRNNARSETTSSTYDTHGNLLVQTQANGIVETSTWYPAAGADGCPRDPEGFVRQLKDKTVTPAPSPQGNAPTLRTRYRYQAMPALLGRELPDWLVAQSETLVQTAPGAEQELQFTAIEYINEPGNPFLHGRIKRRTLTFNATSTVTDYLYEKLDSPQLNVPVQQTTETLSTDFDSVSRSVTQQHSLSSGQELLNLVDGVESRYSYDVLNRLTRETVAPGTDFEASRQYQYTLCAATGQTAEQVNTNAKGVKTRTLLDGLGRPVFEERDHVDSTNPSRFQQTYAAAHNAWNDLAEQTEYDWWEGTSLALTSRFEYDDWAQQSCVIGPDGVEQHQRIDPIGTHESAGPIHRSWRQSGDAEPLISGLSETWLNLFDKPTRTRSLKANGDEGGTQTWLYDGLGRCTEQSDELKHRTRFSYDPWSRLVSSTLPDDSVVSRTYVAHSASELPIALSVGQDADSLSVVGEQHFDGLERLTQVTVGPRTEHYAYDGGKMQVSRRTTAADVAIDYEYNLALTDQPTASHAEDETARFAYDRTSARLTAAVNEQGSRGYDYNAANQLLVERWIDPLGKTWETLYASSMQGRLLKRTDVKTVATEGLDAVYHYDDKLGRLLGIDQGQLLARFDYDSLGQLKSTTCEDKAAGTKLITEYAYDDQGREILRTWRAGSHPPRTLTQTWQIDGLLENRQVREGTVSLLDETFSYDVRGRLTGHACSGATLPRDTEGRAFNNQIFTFDALDNLLVVLTTFADGTRERATFAYAPEDPCRLLGVTYTPARATDNPTFEYDLNGNQTTDERGQRLIYDSQNRLLNVAGTSGQSVSQYRYDSHDHLVTARQGSQAESLHFYQDDRLSTTVQGDRQTRFLYHLDQPLAQQQVGDDASTLLLLTDANLSVVGESQQTDLRTAVYSAYGERHSDEALQSLLAFNGEVRDEASGWYLLGKGYRAYNPSLMRFHSPDSLSPFGSGGVNPYSYCLGNPIALRDPTGHEGWSGRLRRPDEDTTPGLSDRGGGVLEWVFVAIGVVMTMAGAYGTVVTFGTAAAVTVPVMVSGGALAVGTALGAVSTAASAVQAANGDETAGQVALWTGVAGAAVGLAGAGFTKVAGMVAQAAAKSSANMGVSNLIFAGEATPRGIPRPILTPKTIGMASKAASTATRSVGTQTAAEAAATSASISKVLGGGGQAAIDPAALLARSRNLKPIPDTPPKIFSGSEDQLLNAIHNIGAGQSVGTAAGNANSASNTSAVITAKLNAPSVQAARR